MYCKLYFLRLAQDDNRGLFQGVQDNKVNNKMHGILDKRDYEKISLAEKVPQILHSNFFEYLENCSILDENVSSLTLLKVTSLFIKTFVILTRFFTK